ncbi:MAG: DUF924 family protein [Pseudomonadota bacterium]
MKSASEIVAFWRQAGMDKWFGGGRAFDDECRALLHDEHLAASRREFEHWLGNAEGALALVILLDQIPRNIFRGSAHGYATDPLALHYAARAIEAGLDAQVDAELRMFLYLPFEHSEAMADQDRAVALLTALGNDNLLAYGKAHRDVILQFGRFPHRNAALGRDTTPEEQAWLDAGGGF